MRLDANEIIPGLWQGSEPPRGYALAKAGFNVLTLAAEEIQPKLIEFPGIDAVIHAGINDDPGSGMTAKEWRTATRAAKIVSDHVAAGRRVIVTCQAGVNRSGMIVALATRNVTGMSGEDCVALVRHRRGVVKLPGGRHLTPLCNPHFADAVGRLPALRRVARR